VSRSVGPCVVLDGGPRHGWWYTEADWQTLVGSVRSALERGQQVVDTVTGYRPTVEAKTSPDRKQYPDLTGIVWRWRP
jgi:hypothetical protein